MRGLHDGDETDDRDVEQRTKLLGTRREQVGGDIGRGERGPLDDRDGTEAGADLLDHAVNRGGVAQVDGEGSGFDPLAHERLHARRELLGAASDDGHLKSFGAELLRNRGRDARTVTRDNDGL